MKISWGTYIIIFRFENPDQPIEIARLKNGLNIAELFHGPTLAFKDLALCVVGRLYNYFLSKKGEHTTVLIGKIKY